jgi:hypothetical protein
VYRSITVNDPELPLPSQVNGQCSSMHFRELCTPDFLADPRGAKSIQSAVEAGVEVRTVQSLPARMVIVDDHFALIGLVAQVYGTFEWKVVGATTSTTTTEGPGASGSWLGTTIADSAFTEGSSYAWRVQGTDGSTSGEWSSWCEFTVITM